ncbi:hypothetical protein FDECE_7028 [Fusarium decemcellulare]|nr:hypothetical protein FDECE_7028 [Fusarium decemcellulare]
MPRKRRPAKEKAVETMIAPIMLPPTIYGMPLLTDIEIHYFWQFLKFTTAQLSLSPSSSNFWLCYALPMAQVSEPIRYSMIAVGVSHILFKARSVGYSQPWELKRLAIHQYNKAISSILPIMAADRTPNTLNTVLLCCLLFISCEGLLGRYDELFRHLRAGNQLFHDASWQISTSEENEVIEKMIDIFSQLVTASSGMMRDGDCLSGVSKWYRENTISDIVSDLPFKNLDQASRELQQLALWQHNKDLECHSESDEEPDEDFDDGFDQEADEEADPYLQDAFRQWSVRFETFTKHRGSQLSTEFAAQLQDLHLRQQWWQTSVEVLGSEEVPSTKTYGPFMDIAERVAAPFIAMNQPTFFLDGDLISNLFFLAVVLRDEILRARSLHLLRNLNRREGVWDSNDVVEATELIINAREPDPETGEERDISWELSAPGGLPGVIQRLRRADGYATCRG